MSETFWIAIAGLAATLSAGVIGAIAAEIRLTRIWKREAEQRHRQPFIDEVRHYLKATTLIISELAGFSQSGEWHGEKDKKQTVQDLLTAGLLAADASISLDSPSLTAGLSTLETQLKASYQALDDKNQLTKNVMQMFDTKAAIVAELLKIDKA